MAVIFSGSTTGPGLVTDAEAVRISNIGPRGQRHRLRLGLVALGAAVLLAGVLLTLGAPHVWRVALFVPLWIGTLGVFQARDKT